MKDLKYLAYKLHLSIEELTKITNEDYINSHYQEFRKVKKNVDGTLKLDSKGNPKARIINPSLTTLKKVQKRLNANVLSSVILPSYTYGGIKGKNNVRNTKMHQGNKYFFLTD